MSIANLARRCALPFLAAGGLMLAPAAAHARVGVYFGLGGYPAPYVYAPPPPVYYAPPAYYGPPAGYYVAPPPVYYGVPGYYHRHWYRRGY